MKGDVGTRRSFSGLASFPVPGGLAGPSVAPKSTIILCAGDKLHESFQTSHMTSVANPLESLNSK